MHEKLSGYVVFFKAIQPESYEFIPFSQITNSWQEVASMNWFASASVIAQRSQMGLLIDMGSTTTDFILLHQGEPVCQGFTDAARMQEQTLVYTGAVRTPLMALSPRILFREHWTGLAAEYFATTADVYRLLNQLPQEEDVAETADGQDKSPIATARRIARMIGHDVEDYPMQDWINLAQSFKKMQLNQLLEVTIMHLGRLFQLDQSLQNIHIIGAGAGQFLLKELTVELNREMQKKVLANSITIEFQACEDIVLLDKSAVVSAAWASICFPAVAVATLAYQNQLE